MDPVYSLVDVTIQVVVRHDPSTSACEAAEAVAVDATCLLTMDNDDPLDECRIISTQMTNVETRGYCDAQGNLSNE